MASSYNTYGTNLPKFPTPTYTSPTTSPYTAPKPTTNWYQPGTSSTPWDPGKIFQPKQDVYTAPFVAPKAMETWDPAPQVNYTMAPMPKPQMMESYTPIDPPPDATQAGAPFKFSPFNIADMADPNFAKLPDAAPQGVNPPAVTQTTGQNGSNPAQSNQSPNFNFTMDDLIKYMGDTHMPTMDEIQMDPGYKFREQQGLKAIDALSAAHGGFFSTEHPKDLLDYSQGLASQEYGKAYDRYTQNQTTKLNQLGNAWNMLNGDRNFGANRYDTGWNQDHTIARDNQSDYQWNSTTGFDQFKTMMDDWYKRMGFANSNDSGLASTGFSSAKEAADTIASSAGSLAALGMSSAQINAMKNMAASGQNMDMLKSFISIVPSLVALL